MTDHKYVKQGKFKNVNCPYALVSGIVFPSIYAAESYCTREGLDVNVWIQSDDPEVLQECKRIARTTLPVLMALRDASRIEWDKLLDDVKLKAERRDAAKERHEIGWEVHQSWVDAAIGKVDGFHEHMKMLDGYIDTLRKVLYLSPAMEGSSTQISSKREENDRK